MTTNTDTDKLIKVLEEELVYLHGRIVLPDTVTPSTHKSWRRFF